jgi:peptide/nickel transport system substrate-binding protein
MILFSILMLFLFNFSNALPTDGSGKKDSLIIGTSQEYDSLHPHIMAMAAARYLQYMINRPLVTMDANSKWVPMLAEEIPSAKQVKEKNENGKLKNVVTWKIKSKANWSDGTPITCADFAYSLEVGKNPLVQVANKEVYDRIDRIEFDSAKPKSCQFTYSTNSWNYYQMPEFFPLPAHLDQSIFSATKTEKNGYSNKNIYSVGTATKAAYSGPFRVSEVKPGSHIVLERNSHFFGKPAFFSKIVVKIIPNSNTYESHIKSGTLDLIVPIGITFDQALDFEKRWAKENSSQHQVVFREGANFEHLSFNMDSPILKDIRVRQALVQSINREEISKNFFEGKQSAAEFYQSKACPWYPKNISKIKTYKYSLKEAEKLLDSAGWLKKEDGFRYKDGQKLSFGFSTTSGNSIRENVQVYMKNEWKKVGVDIQIKNYPARVLFGEVAKKRQFDGVIMHAWGAAPETAPVGFLASKNIPSESNNWSGFNFGGWNSPAWDKELEKLFSAKTQEKRKSIVVEMLNIYNTELPDFPLFYKTEVAVIPKNMKNYKISGHLYPESSQIETWQY